MARTTLWTSSAAVRPEKYEGGLEQGTHTGGTSTFEIPAGQEVWFHFPLPTPWLVNDLAYYLERVAILWETDNAQVTEVAAYHGPGERYTLSTVPQEGSYLQAGPDIPDNTYTVQTDAGDRPRTGYGVQASIKVKANGGAGRVTFGGAGATFHDTPLRGHREAVARQ
ncbi:hypothetical protein Ssi03_22190 [Sphaerisporangium siamense]|uniref:Uncharacterized protein n=1 Tax=Sphaerisporangium siamense TaxID=795645 RepID=A0A7W7D7S7_9ACTN|nr:DUF6623 family protein [Sphaerisporangium siamense]MBB4701863.1 hypothetical protein [Sphaerisporangium siamense]GII84229.1 hypothetical protein Ssi03_22190 [Sphaerisporangium siamense]